MSLKEQLKILQSKKQYAAMIALLEASDEPQKATIIARIQLKMREAERAEVEVKATTEPVKDAIHRVPAPPAKAKRISRLWRVFLVLLVIMTAAGIVNMVQRVQQIDAKVEADTAWIGLGAYCGRVLARETNISDCDAWREWIRQDYAQVVIDCNEAMPWLYDDERFYDCLEDGLPAKAIGR